MQKWRPLVVLSLAQFLMVLDQAVMNVAISQLVEDFDTTVTTIQAVITFYALVMATLMITGGKVGDIVGRRRAFMIGLVIYGSGSALTAASWNIPSLVFGWSILEGVGAEAGGLQYTAQQLGSAIGTALIGAVVISSLVAAFAANISNEPSIPAELSDAIEVEIGAGASFVAADALEAGLVEAGVADDNTEAVVAVYREAQLSALKTGLLLAALLSVVSLTFTRSLPGRDQTETSDEPTPVST